MANAGWPSGNETLFVVGHDFKNNACLNPYDLSLTRRGEDFKTGADTLIDSAAAGDTYVDTVVYPVVFLYRHYLELTLKDVIWCIRWLENDQQTFPAVHRLDLLWNEAKQLIRSHYGDDSPKELDYLDTLIDEFHKHDPDSMAFRYPFDKKGKLHLENLSHVNVRHLKETMERVGNMLSCISSDLEHRRQFQSEMRSQQ